MSKSYPKNRVTESDTEQGAALLQAPPFKGWNPSRYSSSPGDALRGIVEELANTYWDAKATSTQPEGTDFWARAESVGASEQEWRAHAAELNGLLQERAQREWWYGGIRAEDCFAALVEAPETIADDHIFEPDQASRFLSTDDIPALGLLADATESMGDTTAALEIEQIAYELALKELHATGMYVRFPSAQEVENDDYCAPRRFLYEFGRWVINTTDAAKAKLEMLAAEEDLINLRTLCIAEFTQIGPQHSPFTDNSIDANEGNVFEHFFVFHLEKARLEDILIRRSFVRKMALSQVGRDEFDEKQQSIFSELFETFLDEQSLKACWKESGLTEDNVFDFLVFTNVASRWQSLDRSEIWAMLG